MSRRKRKRRERRRERYEQATQTTPPPEKEMIDFDYKSTEIRLLKELKEYPGTTEDHVEPFTDEKQYTHSRF